jgi:hypothetical protein
MFGFKTKNRNTIRGLCVLTGLLLATDVLALSGSWETKAPKPTAVGATRAGVVNGTLHVVGGSTSSSSWTTLHEVYDPATNTWSTRAPIPLQRSGAATEGIGGKLYVVGGDIGSNAGTAALHIYDPVTNSWSSGAPMPAARNGMASGVINGVLYVAGGDIAGVGVPTSNLYAYDPATNGWSTKAPMPLPRRTAAGAAIGDKLYVVGGLEFCCASKAELQIYDSLSNTWSLGAPLPQARNQLVAGVIGGKFYVVGGGFNVLEVFTPQSANQSPAADAGADQSVAAGPNCLGVVSLNGTGSSDPDGDVLSYTWTGPFGTVYGSTPTVSLPLGTHTITLTVDDGKGGSASDTVVVQVVDATAPTIASASANPASLWPPNHKMVSVTVSVSASDNCSSASCRIVSVTSNEPVNGLGDGDTAPDWVITGNLTVDLRAERAGNGTGRVYTLTVQCTDTAGNSSTKTVTVTVPHSQKK